MEPLEQSNLSHRCFQLVQIGQHIFDDLAGLASKQDEGSFRVFHLAVMSPILVCVCSWTFVFVTYAMAGLPAWVPVPGVLASLFWFWVSELWFLRQWSS